MMNVNAINVVPPAPGPSRVHSCVGEKYSTNLNYSNIVADSFQRSDNQQGAKKV